MCGIVGAIAGGVLGAAIADNDDDDNDEGTHMHDRLWLVNQELSNL